MNKVWVNGCFDLVHSGHLYLLSMAASLGDVYVGIDSDNRIKGKKGVNRPIFSQQERMLLLTLIKGVKNVHIFDTDYELSSLIEKINPDFMLVGEEYKDKEVIGAQYAKQVIFVPKVGAWSTTDIEARILKTNQNYFKFINELVEYGNEK